MWACMDLWQPRLPSGSFQITQLSLQPPINQTSQTKQIPHNKTEQEDSDKETGKKKRCKSEKQKQAWWETLERMSETKYCKSEAMLWTFSEKKEKKKRQTDCQVEAHWHRFLAQPLQLFIVSVCRAWLWLQMLHATIYHLINIHQIHPWIQNGSHEVVHKGHMNAFEQKTVNKENWFILCWWRQWHKKTITLHIRECV